MSRVWKICGASLIASTIMGFILFYALPVHAQAVCAERSKIIGGLKSKYREVPVAIGISQKSTEILEIFSSESGSWTAVVTNQAGIACVMAAGHSWQLKSMNKDDAS